MNALLRDLIRFLVILSSVSIVDLWSVLVATLSELILARITLSQELGIGMLQAIDKGVCGDRGGSGVRMMRARTNGGHNNYSCHQYRHIVLHDECIVLWFV